MKEYFQYIPHLILFIIAIIYIKDKFFDHTDYNSMLQNGGLIIDVRSKLEFSSGNIVNSINIPLYEIASSIQKIPNKDQQIITCCASGMRSASAKAILISKGYTNVTNGGGWISLERKINKK